MVLQGPQASYNVVAGPSYDVAAAGLEYWKDCAATSG